MSVVGVRYRINKGLLKTAVLYKGVWLINRAETRFRKPRVGNLDDLIKIDQAIRGGGTREVRSTRSTGIWGKTLREKKRMKPEEDIFSSEYKEDE